MRVTGHTAAVTVTQGHGAEQHAGQGAHEHGDEQSAVTVTGHTYRRYMGCIDGFRHTGRDSHPSCGGTCLLTLTIKVEGSILACCGQRRQRERGGEGEGEREGEGRPGCQPASRWFVAHTTRAISLPTEDVQHVKHGHDSQHATARPMFKSLNQAAYRGRADEDVQHVGHGHDSQHVGDDGEEERHGHIALGRLRTRRTLWNDSLIG